MVPVLHAVRQFLLSPTAFFEERPPAETVLVATGVVLVFALAFVGGLLVVGSLLGGAVDATVTMDNPERPPDLMCAAHGDDPDSTFGDGCDEPRTVERDAGPLLQQAVYDYLWVGLVAPFVLWVVAGGVLYGTGRIAGGSPSLPGALALAGWAAVPELFRLGVGVIGVWVAFSDLTITDPEQSLAVVQAALAPVEPFLLVATVLTVVWQWYLLSVGLRADAGLSWREAGFAVAVPLGLFTLVGVL